MNEKQIRSLLHHADDQALEQIAAICPAADSRTEQRLSERFQKSTAAEDLQNDAVSVTYQVGTKRRSVLPVTIGAAVCAVVMTVTGLAFLGNRPEPPPEPQLAAETTTETETSEMPETAAVIDADRPTEPEMTSDALIILPMETDSEGEATSPETAQTGTANITSTTSVQTKKPEKTGANANTETKAATGTAKPETSKETTTTETAAVSVFNGTEKLFWDDLVALSKKGDDLTWADFANYEGKDIGSGVFVMKYEIADLDGTYILVCDAETEGKPDSILIKTDDPDDLAYGQSWDIRSEDFQKILAFLEAWEGPEDDETNRAAARKIGERALEKMQEGFYSPGDMTDASEFMDEDMAEIREKHVFTYLCFVDEHTVLLQLNKGLLDVWGYLITDGTVTYDTWDRVSVPSGLGYDGDLVDIEWGSGNLYYFYGGT